MNRIITEVSKDLLKKKTVEQQNEDFVRRGMYFYDSNISCGIRELGRITRTIYRGFTTGFTVNKTVNTIINRVLSTSYSFVLVSFPETVDMDPIEDEIEDWDKFEETQEEFNCYYTDCIEKLKELADTKSKTKVNCNSGREITILIF
jgi:hypothetical protein